MPHFQTSGKDFSSRKSSLNSKNWPYFIAYLQFQFVSISITFYETKGSLTIHQTSVHEGKKPHMCELCGASFARRQKMKSHVATVHEGKKPHQCSICNACFSSKHNMTCHIASAHEKKKPYKCLQCSDSFSRKENLETHVISIH